MDPLQRLKRIVGLFIERPRIIIPFIIRESIIYTVQATLLITAFLTLTYLRSVGRLEIVVSEVLEGRFEEAIQLAVGDPAFDCIIVLGMFTSLSSYIILESFISSGLYPTVGEALVEGQLSLTYMFERAFKGWRKVVPTIVLLSILIYIPLAAVLFSAFALSTMSINNPILQTLALILVISSIVAGIAYLTTIYSPIVAAVDWASPLQALRTSFMIVKSRLPDTMFYVFSQTSILLVLAAVTQASRNVGVLGISATALIPLIVEPLLATYLISIYEEFNSEEIVEVTSPLSSGFKKLYSIFSSSIKLIRDVMKMKAFKIGIVLSTIFFFLGLVGGYTIMSPTLRNLLLQLGIISPKKINPIFRSVNRLFLGVDISFHNWRTAIGTSFSGIAFGIPPLSIVFVNGVVLGAFMATMGDPLTAMPVILPHGIIELSAFTIASASGLMMAFEFVKCLKNIANLENLSKTAIIIAKLLVALLFLFIVAGLIEALITPMVAEFYGWEYG